MSVPKRHGSPPGTYFVSSQTWESRPLFKTEPICQIFVETLFGYRGQNAYLLHAFVLMPDHFHVLLTPAADKTLERAVQYIKGGSARKISEELNFRFPVWQRGFSDHRIRDAEDYEIHVRYIEQNPVKKKFVGVPGDYPWSSASAKVELDQVPQRLKPTSLTAALRHG